MASDQEAHHSRRMSLGFGSAASDDFANLLNSHFGGPEELLPPSEISPLLKLTSDGTMLQELLCTLENGTNVGDAGPGRMFSDDTINAIMGEHFQEYAADVIKDIKEGKDLKDIRVPAIVANPSLHQAVAAVQMQRQKSSTGSMTLKEAQQSMQAAQQQQQQHQVIMQQPPTTVTTAPASTASLPILQQQQQQQQPVSTQPIIMDIQQQQQQQFVTVSGQVIQNMDGSQSVILDPNAIQAVPTSTAMMATAPVQLQQQQQIVANQQQQQLVVQVAGANGMLQYVPVLESRMVGYPSPQVVATTATAPAPVPVPVSSAPPAVVTTTPTDAMLAHTQQLMASAAAQTQHLQAIQQSTGRLTPPSLSRSTSDSAAQAAALANEAHALATMAVAANNLQQQQQQLQPLGSSVVALQSMDMQPSLLPTTGQVTSAPLAIALAAPQQASPRYTTQHSPTINPQNLTAATLSTPTGTPPPTSATAVPLLRPVTTSALYQAAAAHQHQQQQVQQIVPTLRPATAVPPPPILTGAVVAPAMQQQQVVVPSALVSMMDHTSNTVPCEQQQQMMDLNSALPSKPCHKRERSMHSANPLLADPTTAPVEKASRPSFEEIVGGIELGSSPNSALMQDFLAGLESSSGDASPQARSGNGISSLPPAPTFEQQQQQPPTTTTAPRRAPASYSSLDTIPENSAGVPIEGVAGNDVDDDNLPDIKELIRETLAPKPGKRRGRPPGSGRSLPPIPGCATEPTDAEILERLLIEDPQRRLLSPDELRKLMRKEKNRVSAAISRHNTQVYTNHLEEKVRKLEEERTWYAEALEGQQAQQPPHRVLLQGGLSPVSSSPVRHISM